LRLTKLCITEFQGGAHHEEDERKILSLLLTAAMVLTLLPTVTFPAWAAFSDCSGSGSSDDPYIITTADQLTQLATDVNSGTDTTEYIL